MSLTLFPPVTHYISTCRSLLGGGEDKSARRLSSNAIRALKRAKELASSLQHINELRQSRPRFFERCIGLITKLVMRKLTTRRLAKTWAQQPLIVLLDLIRGENVIREESQLGSVLQCGANGGVGIHSNRLRCIIKNSEISFVYHPVSSPK